MTNPNEFEFQHPNAFRAAVAKLRHEKGIAGRNFLKAGSGFETWEKFYLGFTKEEKKEYEQWNRERENTSALLAPKLARFSSSPLPAFVSPDPTTGIHSSVPPSATPMLTSSAGGSGSAPLPAATASSSAGGAGQPPISPSRFPTTGGSGNNPPPGGNGPIGPFPATPPGPGKPRKNRTLRPSANQALTGLENNFVEEINRHLRAKNLPYAVELTMRPSTARAVARQERAGNRINPAVDPDAAQNFREKQLLIYETRPDGTRGRSTSFTLESVMLNATSLKTGKPEQRPMLMLNKTIIPPTMVVGSQTPRPFLPVHIGPEMAQTGDVYMDSFESATDLLKKTIEGTPIGQLSERWGEITAHLPTPTDLNYLGISRMSLEAGPRYDRKAAEIAASYLVFQRGDTLSAKQFRGFTRASALGQSGYEEGPQGSTHSAAVAKAVSGKDKNSVILVRSLANVMMSSGRDITQYIPGANPANPSEPRIISGQTARLGKKSAAELAQSAIEKSRKKTNLRERQGYFPHGMHEIEVEESGDRVGFTGFVVYGAKEMQEGGVNPDTGEKYPEFVSNMDPFGGGGAVASTNVYKSSGRIATADEFFYMPRGKEIDIRNLRIIKGAGGRIRSSGGTIADWGEGNEEGEKSKIRLPRMGYRGGVTIEKWGISFGSDQNTARQIKNLLGNKAPAAEDILSIISDPQSTQRYYYDNGAKKNNPLYLERQRLEKAALAELNKIQAQQVDEVIDKKIKNAKTQDEIDRLEAQREREKRSRRFIRDSVMGGKSGRTVLIPVTSYNATPDSIKGSAIKAMIGHKITDPATRQAIADFEGVKGVKLDQIPLQQIEDELLPSLPRSQHVADVPMQRIIANRLQKSLFGSWYQDAEIDRAADVLSRRQISQRVRKMTIDRMTKKGVRRPEVPVIGMTTAEIKNTPEWQVGTILAYRHHSAPGRDLGADDFRVGDIGAMIRSEYQGFMTSNDPAEREQQLIRAIRDFTPENVDRRNRVFANILKMSPTYGGRLTHLTAYEHFNVEPAGTTNTVNRMSQEALFADAPGLAEYVGEIGGKARDIVQMLMPQSAEEVVEIGKEELSMSIPAYWEAEEPERFEVVKRMFDNARAKQNKSKTASMKLVIPGKDGKPQEIVLASPYAFDKLERGAPGTTLTRLMERIQNPLADGVSSSSIEELWRIHQEAVREYANSDAGNKAMQNIGGRGIKGMAFRYISNPDVPSGKIWVGNKDIASMAEHFGFKVNDFLDRLKAGQKFHIYSQRYPQATGSGAWYEMEHKPDYLGPIAVPTEYNYQVAGDDDGDLANFIAGFRQVTYKRDGKIFNEFVPLPGVETAVAQQNTPLLTALNRFASFYGFKNLNRIIKEARTVMSAHIRDNLSYDPEFIEQFEKKYGKIDQVKNKDAYDRAMNAERDALVAKALVNEFHFVSKTTNTGYHIKALNAYFAGKEQRIDVEKIDAMTRIVTPKTKDSIAQTVANELGAQSVSMTLADIGRGAAEEGGAKREMGVYTVLKDLQRLSDREDHVKAVEEAQFKLYGKYGGNLIEELGSSLRPQNNRYASSFMQATSNLDWVYQRALDMLPKNEASKKFSLDFFTSDVRHFENQAKRQETAKNALMMMLENEEVSPIAIGATFGRRGNADHIAEITSLAEDIKEQIAEIKGRGEDIDGSFFARNEKFKKIMRNPKNGEAYDISNPDIDSAFSAVMRNQAYVNTIRNIAEGQYDDLDLEEKQKINSLLEMHERFINSTENNKRDWQKVASQMREGDTNGFLSDLLTQVGINPELKHLAIDDLEKITGRAIRVDEKPSRTQVLQQAQLNRLNKAMKSGKRADWLDVLGLSQGSISPLLSMNPVVQSLYRRGFGSPELVDNFKDVVSSFRRSFNARASSIFSIANYNTNASEREKTQYVVGESDDVYKASSAMELVNQVIVDMLGGSRVGNSDPTLTDPETFVQKMKLGRNQYNVLMQASPALISGDVYEQTLYESLKASESGGETWLHMGGISMGRASSSDPSASGTYVSGVPDFFKLEDYDDVDPSDPTKSVRRTRVSVFDAKNTRLSKALEKIGYRVDDSSGSVSASDIEDAVPLDKPGTYSGQLETYVWLSQSIGEMRKKLGTGTFEEISKNPDFIVSEYSKEIEKWTKAISKSRGETLETARKTAIRALEAISQGNISAGGIISRNPDRSPIDRQVTSKVKDKAGNPMLSVTPILKGAHILMSPRRLPSSGKGSIEHAVLSYASQAHDILTDVGLQDLAFMRTAVHFAWANQREFLGKEREGGFPDFGQYKPADISPLFGMLRAQSAMAKGETLDHSANSGKLTEEAEETAAILASIRQGSGASASEIANMEYILRGYQRVARGGKIQYEKLGGSVVGDDSTRRPIDVSGRPGEAGPLDDIMLREMVVSMSTDREGSGSRTMNVADAMDIDGVRTTRLAYNAQQMRELISPSLPAGFRSVDLVKSTETVLRNLIKTNALTDNDVRRVFNDKEFVDEYDSYKGDEQKVAEAIQRNALRMIYEKYKDEFGKIAPNAARFEGDSRYGYDERSGMLYTRTPSTIEGARDSVTAFRINPRLFRIKGMFEMLEIAMQRSALAILQNQEAKEKKPAKGFFDQLPIGKLSASARFFAGKEGVVSESRPSIVSSVSQKISQMRDLFAAKKSEEDAARDKWFSREVTREYTGSKAFSTSPDHREWFVRDHLKPMWHMVHWLKDMGVETGQFKEEDIDMEVLHATVMTHDLMKARKTPGDPKDYEDNKGIAAEFAKKMGISDKQAERLVTVLKEMDMVKKKDWWEKNPDAWKALTPEARINSTADSLSHYTGGVRGFLNIFSTITLPASGKDFSLKSMVESNAAKMSKDANKILMDLKIAGRTVPRDKVFTPSAISLAYDPVTKETHASGAIVSAIRGVLEKSGIRHFPFKEGRNRWQTIDPATGEVRDFTPKGKMRGGRLERNDIDIVGEVDHEYIERDQDGNLTVLPAKRGDGKDVVGEFGQEIIFPGEDGELYVSPSSAIKRRDSEQYQSSVRSEQDKAFQNSKMWRPNRAGPGGRNKIFDIDQQISMEGWGKFGFLVPFGGFRSASERMLNIRVNESGDDELDYMDLVWRSFYKGQKKTSGNAIDVAKKYFGNMVSGIAFSHEIPDFEIEERNDGSWSGGWKKDDKENFVFDQDGKKVQEHNILVKSGNLNSLDALFTTFHEIGHFSRWKREGDGEGSEKKIRDWRLVGRRNDYARVLHDEASASLYALKHLKRILSKDQFSDAQQIAVTSLLSYEKTYPGFVLPDKIKTKHSPRVIPVWKPNSKIMEQIHGSNWLSDGFFENSEGKKTSKSIYRGWMPGSDYGFYTKKQIEETFSKYGYARAQGGPVDSGSSYFAGENEAELYNSAGLNRMNRPKAHEPEFGNPLSMGWATVAGYRASANKNSVRDGAGWKLHLAAKKENYAAVDKWLWHNSPYHYKLLAGGTPQESDFTIYAGAKDRATTMAGKIKSSLSHLLMFPGRAASKFGSDRLVNEVVSMRFDPLELPGQGGEAAMGETWFYGRNGIPYDIRGNQIASRYAKLKLGIGMPKGSEEELLSLEKEMDAYDIEQEKYLAEKFSGIYDSLIEKINKTKAANALWSRSQGGIVKEGGFYVAGENAEETYESTSEGYTGNHFEKLNKTYQEFYDSLYKESEDEIKIGLNKTKSENFLKKTASFINFPRKQGDERPLNYRLWSDQNYKSGKINPGFLSDIISVVKSKFHEFKVDLPEIEYRDLSSRSADGVYITEHLDKGAVYIDSRFSEKPSIHGLVTTLHELGHYWDFKRHSFDWNDPYVAGRDAENVYKKEARANANAIFNARYFLKDKRHLAAFDQNALEALIEYEKHIDSYAKNGFSWKGVARASGGPVENDAMYLAGEVDEEYYSEDKRKEYEKVYGEPDHDLDPRAGRFGTISERLLGIEADHWLFPRIRGDKRRFSAIDFGKWTLARSKNDFVSGAEGSDPVSLGRSYFERFMTPWGRKFKVDIDYSSPERWEQNAGTEGHYDSNSQSIAIGPHNKKNSIKSLFTVFHEYGHAYEDLYAYYKDKDPIEYDDFDNVMLKELYADRFAAKHLLASGLIGKHQKGSVIQQSLASLMAYETSMLSDSGSVNWIAKNKNRPSDWLKNLWMPKVGPEDELVLLPRFSRAFGGPVRNGENIVGFVETISPQKSLIHGNSSEKEIIGEFGQEIISPGSDGNLYVAPNSAIKRRNSEHHKSQTRIRKGLGIARIHGGPVDPKTGAVAGESGPEGFVGSTDPDDPLAGVSDEEAYEFGKAGIKGTPVDPEVGVPSPSSSKRGEASAEAPSASGSDAKSGESTGFDWEAFHARLGGLLDEDDDYLLGVPSGATDLAGGIRPVSTNKFIAKQVKAIGELARVLFGPGGAMAGGVYGGSGKKTKKGEKWRFSRDAMGDLFGVRGPHGTISARTDIVNDKNGISLKWDNSTITDLLKKGQLGTSEAAGISHLQSIESRGTDATLEDFDKGVKFLESWIAGVGDPSSEEVKSMSNVLTRVRNMRQAKMILGGRRSGTSISGMTHEEIAAEAESFNKAFSAGSSPSDIKGVVNSFTEQLSKSANLLKQLNEGIDKMVGTAGDAEKTWKTIADQADYLKQWTENAKKRGIGSTEAGARQIRQAEEEHAALQAMLNRGSDLYKETEASLGARGAEELHGKYGLGGTKRGSRLGRAMRDPYYAAFAAHFVRDMGFAIRESIMPAVFQASDYGISVNKDRELLARVGESVGSINDPASRFLAFRESWNKGMGRDSANVLGMLGGSDSTVVTALRGLNQVVQPAIGVGTAMVAANMAFPTLGFSGPAIAGVVAGTAMAATGAYTLGAMKNEKEMAIAKSLAETGGNPFGRSLFTGLGHLFGTNGSELSFENNFLKGAISGFMTPVAAVLAGANAIKQTGTAIYGDAEYQISVQEQQLNQERERQKNTILSYEQYKKNQRERDNASPGGVNQRNKGGKGGAGMYSPLKIDSVEENVSSSSINQVGKGGYGVMAKPQDKNTGQLISTPTPTVASSDGNRPTSPTPQKTPTPVSTPIATRVPYVENKGETTPPVLGDPVLQVGGSCNVASASSFVGPLLPDSETNVKGQQIYQNVASDLGLIENRYVYNTTTNEALVNYFQDKGAAIKKVSIPLQELITGVDAEGNPSKYAKVFPQDVDVMGYYVPGFSFGSGPHGYYPRNGPGEGHSLIRLAPNWIQNTNDSKNLNKAIYVPDESLFQGMEQWSQQNKSEKPGSETVEMIIPDFDAPPKWRPGTPPSMIGALGSEYVNKFFGYNDYSARKNARDFARKYPEIYPFPLPPKDLPIEESWEGYFKETDRGLERKRSGFSFEKSFSFLPSLLRIDQGRSVVPGDFNPPTPTSRATIAATATASPTATDAPATSTRKAPTSTKIVPTATNIPATSTPAPTSTEPSPTATKRRPTSTDEPEATATKTVVTPPVSTPTASATPTKRPPTATKEKEDKKEEERRSDTTATATAKATIRATIDAPTATIEPYSTATVGKRFAVTIAPPEATSGPRSTAVVGKTSSSTPNAATATASPVSLVTVGRTRTAEITNAAVNAFGIQDMRGSGYSPENKGVADSVEKMYTDRIRLEQKTIQDMERNLFEARLDLAASKKLERAALLATKINSELPPYDPRKNPDDMPMHIGMSAQEMNFFRDKVTGGGDESHYAKYMKRLGIDSGTDMSKEVTAVAQIYGGNPGTERYASFFYAAADRLALGENVSESMQVAQQLGQSFGYQGFYGGSSFFADRSRMGTLLTYAQMTDAVSNNTLMGTSQMIPAIMMQTGANVGRVASSFEPLTFNRAYNNAEAVAFGQLGFVESMQKFDIERLTKEGKLAPTGLDVSEIMREDVQFDDFKNYELFMRSGVNLERAADAGKYYYGSPSSKGFYMKSQALFDMAQKGGVQAEMRLNAMGFSSSYLNQAMKNPYAAKVFSGLAMGDSFSVSAAYNSFANMPGISLQPMTPTMDWSTGTQLFQHSAWGLTVPRQSPVRMGDGLPRESGTFTLQVPSNWDSMSLQQQQSYNAENAVPIVREFLSKTDISKMGFSVSKETIGDIAGTNWTAIQNGKVVPLGGIEGAYKGLRVSQARASLASAAASVNNLKLQREFELSFSRPMDEYQALQRQASLFGGTVESPFGNGTLDFGKGQMEYQKMGMALQLQDMVANQRQVMGRLGWQAQDLVRGRQRQLVQAGYQRQDFEFQERGMALSRQSQSFDFAFQAREMGIGQQQYREDYAYNKRMRQMQFGWQMEDADTNIRRATGFERRQLIKNREREVITFNAQTEQSEKENKRQQEAFKRQEEKFNKEVEHYKQAIALEDEQFRASKERFNQQQKWEEEDYNIQIERNSQEAAWAEESFERQMQRFNLEKEQFDLDMKNQKVLQDDEKSFREASKKLADETYKNNLKAAEAAAGAAAKAVEVEASVKEITNGLELAVGAMEKFMEKETWWEVSKAMDKIVWMYRQVNGTDKENGRAAGGPVFSGKTYIVGELGPEMLTVNKAGQPTVLPNSALPRSAYSRGSAEQVIHIHVMMDSDEIATYTAGKANTLAARNRRRAFNG